jgi:hypothetical protein
MIFSLVRVGRPAFLQFGKTTPEIVTDRNYPSAFMKQRQVEGEIAGPLTPLLNFD